MYGNNLKLKETIDNEVYKSIEYIPFPSQFNRLRTSLSSIPHWKMRTNAKRYR